MDIGSFSQCQGKSISNVSLIRLIDEQYQTNIQVINTISMFFRFGKQWKSKEANVDTVLKFNISNASNKIDVVILINDISTEMSM